MARFWDTRARENPFYFVDNKLSYRGRDDDLFWNRGERELDEMLTALDLAIRPVDDVVDVGCGLGRLTRVVARRAASVRAIDVSAEMLRRARELNPHLANVSWLQGDGTSLSGIDDGSATLCLSLVVFQHIPDPEVTLGYVGEMGRVLKPGGRAGFQISDDPAIHRWRWDRQMWRVRIGSLLGRAPRPQSHPAWRGSAVGVDRVAQAAKASGMRVERVSGAGKQLCFVRLVKD